MDPEPFLSGRVDPVLAGESEGEGPDVFLCHGLSATRRYVTHGSHALPRAGYRVHTYDARGHGESGAAPPDQGYGYEFLVRDLDRVVAERASDPRVVVGGHSMGCHTAVAWALDRPDLVEALILIGPVYTGDEALGDDERWDDRAEALETGGPEAFAAEVSRGFSDPGVAARVGRLALDRAGLHRNREAVADALRQVPRSAPFEELGELESIQVPTLVVGSRDDLDPGHPLAVAIAWAEAIPGARLVVEEEGEAPLSWQGGRLSRTIAEFLDERLDAREDSEEAPEEER